MEILDSELHAHLKATGISAETYAFPSILTFSACTPPLDEVLQLWDFLLAFGVHLNVLCVVAQLYLCRQAILDDPR
jgi:cell cycle arrest protein BUB2